MMLPVEVIPEAYRRTVRYRRSHTRPPGNGTPDSRQSQSKPLLTSLHEWLIEKSATLSKKSRLGEAFAYVLNQWDALYYYCDDGLAEPDNNVAERALRAVCLGKKNYIFFGSDHGGERGALLYGLIGTCRLNGIDPEAYTSPYPERVAGVAL